MTAPHASRPLNFAVTGVAGFVAPRHLNAIRDTGNRLVAAVDPHDAVGLLDRYSFSARFFTEIERFDRHLEKLRRASDDERVDYVSICSPNYLHDAHIRLALRAGANVICEKPIVINPWNLDPLQELERESGRRINTVLQLRLHPAVQAFREAMTGESDHRHQVTLTYITARGGWYDVSWKGSDERSGGIVTNIGIHFFDLLIWLFGAVRRSDVHLLTLKTAAGSLELERADVRWFLSTNIADLPFDPAPGSRTTFRAMTVDGVQLEVSDGFGDLHTRVYQDILAGGGCGVDAARPSIELTHQIRHAAITDPRAALAPPAAGQTTP